MSTRVLRLAITTVVIGLLTLTGVQASSAVGPAAGPAATRGPDQARYRLRLHQTGDSTRRWAGRESVGFRNNGARPLDRVYLRLWGNGLGRCHRPLAEQVSDVRGGDVVGSSEHCTGLMVALRTPVAPGARGRIGFHVAIRAPATATRFGSHHGTSYLTNAVPILAVRQHGRWQRTPYVDDGESFYSLTSSWQVLLTHDPRVRVPATGTVVAESQDADGVTTAIHASHARDFAFVAGRLHHLTRRLPAGVGVDDVRIWWTGKGKRAAADRQARLAVRAITLFTRLMGPLGQRSVDVVDADFRLGGMEYPELVLSELHGPTVHELAHQWFYSRVGDDQYHSPWLDESFAQYANYRFYSDAAGSCAGPSYLGDERLTDGMAFYGSHAGEYYNAIYGNGPCALLALRRVLGASAFDPMLRGYYRAHRDGVTTTGAFQHAAQRAAGSRDLTGFWRRWRIGG